MSSDDSDTYPEDFALPQPVDKQVRLEVGPVHLEQRIEEMKQVADHFRFTEEELPDIEMMSQADLSSEVYEKIKKAKPFSTIELPNKPIILPQLNILTPLTIVGQAGSVIELINGNIICDFTDFCRQYFNGIGLRNYKDFRINISQVSILFKFDPD